MEPMRSEDKLDVWETEKSRMTGACPPSFLSTSNKKNRLLLSIREYTGSQF